MPVRLLSHYSLWELSSGPTPYLQHLRTLSAHVLPTQLLGCGREERERERYRGHKCVCVCVFTEAEKRAGEVNECPRETTLGEEEVVGGQAEEK